MNGRLFMEAMGDIKDDFIMEAADLDEIRKSFSEWDDEEDDVTTEPEKTGHKKIKRIPKIRKLLVAAVISVSLLLAANFVAMAMGYDSLAILKEFGDRLIEMFDGEKTEYKGITIIKENEAISFSSINEFFKKTDLDILYPSVFSKNIKIDTIFVCGSYDKNLIYSSEYLEVNFNTTKPKEYSVTVNTHPNASKEFMTNSNIVIEQINSFECYVAKDKFPMQCNFIRNNYVYTIIAPTYDDIVTIVSNMKEYEE